MDISIPPPCVDETASHCRFTGIDNGYECVSTTSMQPSTSTVDPTPVDLEYDTIPTIRGRLETQTIIVVGFTCILVAIPLVMVFLLLRKDKFQTQRRRQQQQEIRERHHLGGESLPQDENAQEGENITDQSAALPIVVMLKKSATETCTDDTEISRHPSTCLRSANGTSKGLSISENDNARQTVSPPTIDSKKSSVNESRRDDSLKPFPSYLIERLVKPSDEIQDNFSTKKMQDDLHFDKGRGRQSWSLLTEALSRRPMSEKQILNSDSDAFSDDSDGAIFLGDRMPSSEGSPVPFDPSPNISPRVLSFSAKPETSANMHSSYHSNASDGVNDDQLEAVRSILSRRLSVLSTTQNSEHPERHNSASSCDDRPVAKALEARNRVIARLRKRAIEEKQKQQKQEQLQRT